MDRVRLAHSKFGAGNAPVSLAIEQGFLEDRGIEVDRVEMPRTSIAVEAVVAREIDVCVCGGVPIVRAAMAGGDPLIVMSLEAHNVVAMIGAKDIRSPEDLKGRTIGIVGLPDQDHILQRRALREWGIDPGTDVTFKEYGDRGSMWEALLRGEIGSMAATIPQPLLARKMGFPIIRDFRDVPEMWQVGTFVTTRRFADENPDLLRRFLAGLRQGIELFSEDFDVSLPHLKARSKLDDVEVLAETRRLFIESMKHYVPSPEPIGNVIRDMRAAGETVEVDVSALIDTSFVPPYPDGHPG